jgi:unsaturated rhamnogalacturonyl hydrolase
MEKTRNSLPETANLDSGTFIATGRRKSTRMKVSSLFIFIFFISVSYGQDLSHRVIVSVKRNYAIPKTESARLVFDLHELKKRVRGLSDANLIVIDQHFGKQLAVSITSAKPEKVVFNYSFQSDEPVFAFMVTSSGTNPMATLTETVTPDPKFDLSYMVPSSTKGKTPLGDRIVMSTMHAYPDQKKLSIISPGKWTYEYGFFMNAVFVLSEKSKNQDYFNYAKGWIDNFITAEGKFREGVYNRAEYRLDDILPGRLAISLYQKTGEKKYKELADHLADHLAHQPKTSEGGYWHKEIYPNQMWLDGIYMGDVFSMQYAAAFNKPEMFDESVKQILLMYKHAADPATGLLFHGWDESKNKVWANQTTGASPELWSRAIGWYAMALIECLDYLPANHPERKNIEAMFQKLCASILKYQDGKTALWYQIINKGDSKDNWIETSASAMFTYAFAKGAHKNLLDESYLDAATKGFNSIWNNYMYSDEHGDVHLDQAVKVGSLNIKNSKGDYDYYINCERRLDDYKGLAALLYTSIELNR